MTINHTPAPADHVGATEDQWKPWIDMPVGDHRNIVREVMSEDGRTALAYFTGKFMALAPVSDSPTHLPFKVWLQRSAQPAPETNVPGIKNLQWIPIGYNSTNGHTGRQIVAKAEHPYGIYTVERVTDDKWWVLLGYVGDDIAGPFDSEAEALSQAQVDLSTRIHSFVAAPPRAANAGAQALAAAGIDEVIQADATTVIINANEFVFTNLPHRYPFTMAPADHLATEPDAIEQAYRNGFIDGAKELSGNLQHAQETVRGLQGILEQLSENQISKAVIDLITERRRQIAVEGWPPEHDDEHRNGEMALAAGSYCESAARPKILARKPGMAFALPKLWPLSWSRDWWKPKSPREDLVRAGGLIIADIERLDRAAVSEGSTDE